jgi:hypothetical protein
MVCEHPNNTFTNTQRTSIKPITEQNPGARIKNKNPRRTLEFSIRD